MIGFNGNRLGAPLTPRQQEVHALIAQGLSNKEAANALGLSEASIRTHAQGLYIRLGVRNRTEAAMRFR